jgi:hypothetical protein
MTPPFSPLCRFSPDASADIAASFHFSCRWLHYAFIADYDARRFRRCRFCYATLSSAYAMISPLHADSHFIDAAS